MDILVNVVNQKLKVATNLKTFVEGTQKFIRFVFNLPSDWSPLTTFAQFGQNGQGYNVYLDENSSAYLPSEIKAGTCTMMLYGTGGDTIGTTNYLTLTIDQNMLIANAQSTNISTSLYSQLVNQVSALSGRVDQIENSGVSSSAISAAVQKELNSYLQSGVLANMTIANGSIDKSKVNAEFSNTLSRADSAMQPSVYDPQGIRSDIFAYAQNRVNSVQSSVNSLQTRVNTIQNSVNSSNNKVDEVYENYSVLQGNVSILQSSVNSLSNDIVSVNNKIINVEDSANIVENRVNTVSDSVDVMQKDVYEIKDDISEIEQDIDVIEKDITKVRSEIQSGVQNAVDQSKSYTDGRFSAYQPYYIQVVDVLPSKGENNKFYLMPNETGTKYDKYWWITDENGVGKWDVFGGSSTVVVSELPESGESDVDYILKSENGCLYYKWIDGTWNIVAGSIASVVETLPEFGNEFADYYLLNEDGTYAHYRYIDNAFCAIGGTSYSKLQIDEMLSDVLTKTNTNAQNIESNTTNIASLSTSLTNLQQEVKNIDTEGYTYYATYGNATLMTGEEASNVYTLYEVKDDVESIKSQFVITGGGGGSSSATNLVVERITQSPVVATSTDKIEIKINYSSTDSDGELIDGSYTWKIGNSIISTGVLVQGENTFDLTDAVTVGTQKLTLTVVDEGGSVNVKSWTVQVVDVRIESSFSDRYTTPIGRSVSFTYTPYGAINKTIHFKVDGVEETVVTSASGTLQSYIIQAKDHGSHLLEVWITAIINNVEVETNHIFKDIIWYDETAENAVIGCIYRNDYYGIVTTRQYDTTAIVYNVFDPSTSSPIVKRYVDDELIGTDTVSSSYNVWNFKSDNVGIYTLRIEVGRESVVIKVDVKELGIDVSPIIANLEVDFNPTGITNSSEDRIWSNGNYNMSVSSNFDWDNGGYKVDENGDTYFLVKAGTHAIFDYKLFSGGIDGNPSVLGSEMKLIFKTENVQDANAVWLTSVENGVGIQMSVHDGWLKTNTASNTDIEGDENTESVAATNTYLYMPYSEQDIIEMDINIDPINRDDATAKSFVMAYEDGVPSKAFVYDSSDRFYQYTPQPITIGSDYCDVRIYRLKIYSSSLTTEDVMKNFIADSRDSTTMLDRYDKNSIYYNRETNTYTPYSSGGVLDPEKLAPIIPNVKVLMLETDHFTTSKKTFVKSKLRCIHASSGGLFSGDPYLDNWLFENGYHSGQGTTSDNYGNSGRNVDFLFNCDGVHKPSDKVDAEDGYVSKVTLGYGTENAMTEVVTDWKGIEGKVALTRTSVPNNFFNLKVNVASSENVNNALLQKRYNDFLPYISPAKKRDDKIKNTMEFVPAVLFLKETNPDISTHNEFLDCEWHFYALGNIGDSKKTDYTRAYDPEDMNEFVIEISDNTKNNATFQSGVYLDENGERQIEKFTIIETEDDGDIILTPVSTDKPQSFVYPITQEEWENENNMRYWCMYNEGFDGDHSFEPRYACCGDYRDGKLVNDTTGRGKAQVELNNDVWRAFYRWVITSTDDEFKNELDQWCVRSAVEFFYAFTHIYTMMDNRAKNTFWHFAKTGIYREVTKPVSELLHIYCELVDGEYVTTTDTEIHSDKTYYTQYAFDLWDYDNDKFCRCKTFSNIRRKSRDGQRQGKSSID